MRVAGASCIRRHPFTLYTRNRRSAMKIIKRNGAEVPFDITKIITAVTKASDSVGGKARLSREQITDIAAAVTDQCQALNRAVSVEEVQDMVENQLMDIKAHDIARHYITYRYIQSLKRQTNTTDERILSLIECQNEEVKQENANKNPTVNSVQRDYMAGEISKDLTARLLLDRRSLRRIRKALSTSTTPTILPNTCTTVTSSIWTICSRTAPSSPAPILRSPTVSPPPATSPPRSLHRWLPTSMAVRASA